jgi:hypothetical protein
MWQLQISHCSSFSAAAAGAVGTGLLWMEDNVVKMVGRRKASSADSLSQCQARLDGREGRGGEGDSSC